MKRLGHGLLGLLFVLLSQPTWSKVSFSVGPEPLGTLTLKNGNLSCEPYHCELPLEEGQSLQAVKTSLPVFQLLSHGKTLRYYFYSNDVLHIPAYSGQPIGILIGLDSSGIIRDTRLIEHDEPILLAGIPIRLLVNAITSYQGKNIAEHVTIESDKQASDSTVDLITGATVTSLVVHETILNTSRKVAKTIGILKSTHEQQATIKTTFTPMTWDQLVNLGAIGHLTIQPEEMGLPNDGKPWLDLYFADLVQPTIGQNLLGKSAYDLLMSYLAPHQSALMIVSNGVWSFKGSAFVRGGIFDRFHIEQNLMAYTFRDTDYHPLYGLAASGSPAFHESGVFTITSTHYDRTQPWTLMLLASRLDGVTAVSRVYKTFQSTYHFPTRLIQDNVSSPSLVGQLWRTHGLGIAWTLMVWFAVILIFVCRRRLAQDKVILEKVHLTFLGLSFLTFGVVQHDQPSVVDIFTLMDVLWQQNSFSTFLLDPYLTIGWTMIFLTLMVWGRSLFCGWICPFGAIQELLYKLRIKITPYKHSLEPSEPSIRRLRLIRFGLFFMLLGLSFYSLSTAEMLSEVEPFKTAWTIGVFHRAWPYGLYVGLLLVLGILNYRFFCRFVCPLGAGLALLSFFPLKPLPRRKACVACRLCHKGCEPHAISEKDGHINAAECLGCFECINKLDDVKTCPPLMNPKLWRKFGEDVV